VITDEYSRYPVVEIIQSVSGHTVIPALDKVIAAYGIPKVIKTDNGSPFNSYQFRECAEHTGFAHRRITPRWPRANAQAKSLNKSLMKNIKAAEIERKSWKQSMYSSTGVTPFKLLFGRETNTKLPSASKAKRPELDEFARQNDEYAKTRMTD
jgi:putative transposase